MPGTFAYTKSTNIVVVTAGTSVAPATFADFVTADRAGSVTLLATTAGLSPTLPLTYQITPVEKLALLISFIVASKTAQTDYIFITGTDAWDNAQTESIDVSVGNGTYVSTKRFRTITNIDCSDNPAGGGVVWADGTVAVTQPQWGVIWDKGNKQYQIDSNVNFGDASTSTVFQSQNEQVYFLDGAVFIVVANATLTIGALVGSYGINGSFWSVGNTADWTPLATSGAGTFLLYASKLMTRNPYRCMLRGGTFTAIDSRFSNNWVTGNSQYLRQFDFRDNLIYTLTNVYFESLFYPYF